MNQRHSNAAPVSGELRLGQDAITWPVTHSVTLQLCVALWGSWQPVDLTVVPIQTYEKKKGVWIKLLINTTVSTSTDYTDEFKTSF